MENTIRPYCGEELVVEEERIQTEVDVQKKSRKGGDCYAGIKTEELFDYTAGLRREHPKEYQR